MPPASRDHQNPNTAMWATLTHMLALNRSAEYISQMDSASLKSSANDPAKQKETLEAMIYDIHAKLYRDTHSFSQNENDPKAGYVTDPVKRSTLRSIIHELAENLFDANANAVYLEAPELAKIYAETYQKLGELKPFDYGNGLTLSTFITAVSRIPKEREISGTAIDFRRLSDQELEIFNSDGTPKQGTLPQLIDVFTHALDATRNAVIRNQRAKSEQLTIPGDNKFYPNKLAPGEVQDSKILKGWQDNRIEINGVPFLGKQEEDGLYLVTVTGGLVPYQQAFDAINSDIMAEKLVDEYPHFSAEKYVAAKPTQDGIADGYHYTAEQAPLICMDANILTGLRPESHQKFLDTIESFKGDEGVFNKPADQVKMTDLEHKPIRKAFLAKVHELGDERLAKICEIGCQHIRDITRQMHAEVDREVAGKMPVDHPLMVVSMGGSGSGKSGVEQYIKKHCEGGQENYVFTTLDGYRDRSALYKIIQTVGHHSDDYSLVEPMANNLRNWVADRAMENNLNLLYDGSAIPYLGKRSDDLLNKALKTGSLNGKTPNKKRYRIDVVAADAYFDIPKESQAHNLTEPTSRRVLDRLERDNRCLPWAVTTGKHTQALTSFLDAANDSRITNALLINTDGKYNKDSKKNESYVAAAAFTPTKEELEAAKTLDPNAYEAVVKAHGVSEEEVKKIPYLNPENIGYTQHISDGKERLMVITDMHKMVQMAEKSLQNPYAADLDAIHCRTSDKAAMIPSPHLNFVERVIASPGAELSKVLNYIKPSVNYQKALEAKREQIAGGTSIA